VSRKKYSSHFLIWHAPFFLFFPLRKEIFLPPLSAPAEANIGRGFCIKAVARYAVLTNIFLLFFSTAAGIVLKNF